MRQSKTVRDFTEAELELAKEGALLHGLSLEQLGFYGAMDLPAISVGQGIGEFVRGVLEEAAEDGLTTPELIDFARTEALIRAGALRVSVRELLELLFIDHVSVGHFDYDLDDGAALAAWVATDSCILNALPRAFAPAYDTAFVQRLIVVAADLSVKLDGKWTYPSCVAQEILVFITNGLANDLLSGARLDSIDGFDLDAEVPQFDFREPLLDDVDFEFLYDISTVGASRAMAMARAIGAANLGFKDWFVPFNAGVSTGGFAYPPGQSYGPEVWERNMADRYHLIPEGSDDVVRDQGLGAGVLVTLDDDDDEPLFDRPVVIEKALLDALGDDEDLPMSVLWEALKAAREHAADRCVPFSFEAGEEDGIELLLVASQGTEGALRLTVQRAPEKRTYLF